MSDLLFLIPLLPVVAATVNFIFGRWWLRSLAGPIAVAAIAGSWILSLLAFIDQTGSDDPLKQHLYTWIPAGDLSIPMNLQIDHLTSAMLMLVTTVSLLVHIYSLGYMHGEDGFYRFFSYLPLFVFSMIMLVMADNFLTLFVFWEGVGLCSYLLIGYYFRRKSASDAAKKAFIVNRIGDLGFLIGMMLIFVHTGSLMFSEVFKHVPDLSESTLFWIAVLLFTGACGKSAQLPLFVWLPDAMEGPTPVSALIHAATMVTAGIYMMARSFPIFDAAPDARVVIAVIGILTALIAGSIGITQHDIKRVVAYSTVSQLGFMTFAIGVGAWIPAIFHLLTHGFFKALLFLGSGSVIHGMHGEQDMRRMGGLKKYMPITYWTFLIAAGANAGLFPLAGFWSKDEILVGSWLENFWWVTILGFIAAFFTSLYMFRVVFLTFHGKERFDTKHIHPHESPRVMAWPLMALVVPTIALGMVVGWPPEEGWIHDFLEPNFHVVESAGDHAVAAISFATEAEGEGEHAEGGHHVSTAMSLFFAGLSTVVALGGVLVAYMAYMKKHPAFSPSLWAARFGGLYQLVYRKFMLDELYQYLIVNPMHVASRLLWQVVDVRIIDGAVNGVAGTVAFTSSRLRRVQTGFVANYVLAIAVGAVLIIGAFFLFDSSLFS